MLRLDTWQETLSVCLHAFSFAFVVSRWWEWTHMPWQRAHRKSSNPTTSSSSLSMVHKRPQVTSDPSGIHSDWGKVLTVAQQEQCSVVSKREGVGGWEGGGDSLPLLSPSLSVSVPPFIQTQKLCGVTTRQEQTGELIFPSGIRKELGMAAKLSSPWTHTQETSSELSSDCFVAYRSEKRERERGGDSWSQGGFHSHREAERSRKR